MKKILKKILTKIGFLPKKTNTLDRIDIQYKIGNVKHHNSIIDGLIPQLVEIGDDFVSAPGSMILAHDASTYLHTKKHRIEKTVIGNKVFLGAYAVVLPGVKIGDGAIIGSGAIVTKNVEAYTVVAGNPARYIGSVDDYIKKCEERDVLFDTPSFFSKLFDGEKYTKEDKEKFQESYLDTLKNKHD